MPRMVGLALGVVLSIASGCTSIDSTATSSVWMESRHGGDRGCYPQESLYQPRFGVCPGYHEKP